MKQTNYASLHGFVEEPTEQISTPFVYKATEPPTVDPIAKFFLIACGVALVVLAVKKLK